MSVSAFGVEHITISKRKKDDRAANGALIGGGGAAATLGYVGGGLPIRSEPKVAKPDPLDRGLKGWANVRANAEHFLPSGMYGARVKSHRWVQTKAENGTNYFRGKPGTQWDMYERGFSAGAIPAEKKIISNMKVGRRVANGFLIGGLGAAGYGAYRMKQHKKKKKISKAYRNKERDSGIALGTGATLGISGEAGRRIFTGQKNRWYGVEAAEKEKAGQVVRRLTPDTRNRDVKANVKDIFRGHSKEKIIEAATHRGTAAQAAHFGYVYGQHLPYARGVRNAGVALAGIGAGGLIYSRKKKR